MLHLTAEDTASIAVVLEVLEVQAAKLGPASRIIELWRDWAGVLEPTFEEQLAVSTPSAA